MKYNYIDFLKTIFLQKELGKLKEKFGSPRKGACDMNGTLETKDSNGHCSGEFFRFNSIPQVTFFTKQKNDNISTTKIT